MNIKSIKVSRLSEMVWLTFSDGKYLPVRSDDIVIHHLSPGDDVDSERQKFIYQLSFQYLLKRYALRQIASSAKTAFSLRQKLKIKYLQLHQKYQPPQLEVNALVEDIIQQLESNKLLDELGYVESLLRRQARKSSGYLRNLLLSQGINPTKYQKILAGSDDIVKIKKLLPRLGTDQKAILKLIRRGFALNTVKKAIDEYLNS